MTASSDEVEADEFIRIDEELLLLRVKTTYFAVKFTLDSLQGG